MLTLNPGFWWVFSYVWKVLIVLVMILTTKLQIIVLIGCQGRNMGCTPKDWNWNGSLSSLPPSFLPCYILSYLGENLLFSVCLSVRQSHRKSGWACLPTPHTDDSATYRESEEAVFPHLDSFRHVADGGVFWNGRGDLLNSLILKRIHKWFGASYFNVDTNYSLQFLYIFVRVD